MSAVAAFAPLPTSTAIATPRRIFRSVRQSMWSWRMAVRTAMLNFASRDLPAGKRRRDWKNKAHQFATCGRTVAALACNGCNNINFKSGTLVATCGLRICPICARRKAEKLRHRLRVAWDTMKHDRRHGLYFITLTMRYDPADPAEVSAEGLLRRKTELLTAWSSVWRQYLKPRAAAACRAIEVGASGMVHLHVLYAGRRPDVETLRMRWMDQVGDSPLVNVRYCKQPHKAIVELAKYVTKGASPAKVSIVSGVAGAFMDPELAVRVEIAFSGDRMVQCYGQWLGITVDDDEDPQNEQSSAALHAAACPHCGLVGEWHAANYYIDEWWERFADEIKVSGWKPRIGGAGPRRKGDTENGPNHARAPERELDTSRRIILGRNDRAERRRPSWAQGTARLGEEPQLDRPPQH